MGPLLYDRVMETTTTTGTGTLTLAGAVTGFRSFSAVGNTNTCYYTIYEVDSNGNPSGAWETGIGTYTSSGTTLSRDKILASSNSNNAVSFGAGDKRVILTAPASILEPSNTLCNGRLTTESGVAVSAGDRTAQSTIYFTPHRGNRIALWNGNSWVIHAFTERSLALSGLTSGKNYDVFLYDNAGTLTLELSAAWSTDTARTDALTTQDGVYVKSGAATRRYLGTIRTTATTTTEDSGGGGTTQVGGKRFVWNYYNPVPRNLAVVDTTDGWSYSTNSWRAWNNTAGNKVEFVIGIDEYNVEAFMNGQAFPTSNGGEGSVAIGLDSSTAIAAACRFGQLYVVTANSLVASTTAVYRGRPGIGYHYLQAIEKTHAGTVRYDGDNTGKISSGMAASVWG